MDSDNNKVSLILRHFLKLLADLKVNCHPILCAHALLRGQNALVSHRHGGKKFKGAVNYQIIFVPHPGTSNSCSTTHTSLRDVLIEEPTIHLMPKVKGRVIFTSPEMRFCFHCPRQYYDLVPGPASPLSLGHCNLSLSVARGEDWDSLFPITLNASPTAHGPIAHEYEYTYK